MFILCSTFIHYRRWLRLVNVAVVSSIGKDGDGDEPPPLLDAETDEVVDDAPLPIAQAELRTIASPRLYYHRRDYLIIAMMSIAGIYCHRRYFAIDADRWARLVAII